MIKQRKNCKNLASDILGPVKVVTEPLDAHLESTDKQNHCPLFTAEQQTASIRLGSDSAAGQGEHSVLRALKDGVHESSAAGEGNEECLPTQSGHVNEHFPSLAPPRAKGKVYNFHFQASPKVTLNLHD